MVASSRGRRRRAGGCSRDRSTARTPTGLRYRAGRASRYVPCGTSLAQTNRSRFRRPPYNPGRSDFPSPVLTLAFPPRAFPVEVKLKRGRAYAPTPKGLHAGSPRDSGTVIARRRGRSPPKHQDRQVPRAPLPEAGVTGFGMASCAIWEGVTPPSSLRRTHAPDHVPLTACSLGLGEGSSQVVTRPCCDMALPDVISASPVPGFLDPYPGCPLGASAHFFPRGTDLPRFLTRVGASQTPHNGFCGGSKFRGCSHSVTFRPPDLLATQTVPTAAPFDAGQPWRCPRAMRESLPSHAAS